MSCQHCSVQPWQLKFKALTFDVFPCVYLRRQLKRSELENIWPFDFFFGGEVLIKTDVGSGLRCRTLSSSKWEIGNKLMLTTCRHKVTVTEEHSTGRVYLLLRAPLLPPINQLMLQQRLMQPLQLQHMSNISLPFFLRFIYNPNEKWKSVAIWCNLKTRPPSPTTISLS